MLVFFWAAAFAGGFEVAQQGAATAGMGHAGVALRGAAESAWFNPAALADGGGLRLTLGITLARSQIRATSLPTAEGEAWSAHTDNPLGTPPWFYLSYARGRVAGAITANAPFGGGVRWPEDWSQRFEIIRSKPQFFRVAGSVAVRVGPVRLGAGVHVDTGSLAIEKATDHVSEEGHVAIALRGTGVGGDAFMHVDAGEKATFGLTYRSRTALALSGEADFDVPPAFASGVPDQAVSSRWTLPDRVSLGMAWTEERWRAAFEVGLTLWSVNDELVLDFADPVSEDTVQVNAWRDTLALRAGAAGRVHERVELRGGAYVDGLFGAPPPAERLGPSSPDGTRLGATAGLGVQAHRLLRLDGWVEPLVVLRRESTSVDLPEAAYQGWAIAGGIGLTVEAAPRPRVHGEEPPVWGTVPAPEAPAEVPPEISPDSPWDRPDR